MRIEQLREICDSEISRGKAAATATGATSDAILAATVREYVHTRIRELVLPILQDHARELSEVRSRMADAGRIAELETRLAGYEKRLAGLDTATNAHRRHLQNIEVKIGAIVNPESAR